jgi:hypothetical protein
VTVSVDSDIIEGWGGDDLQPHLRNRKQLICSALYHATCMIFGVKSQMPIRMEEHYGSERNRAY